MSIYLQITSGRGPEECGWVVAHLVAIILKEARTASLEVDEIEVVPGVPSTLRSVVFKVEGEGSENFIRSWVGTILWVGQSPFRPHHKRKNWFVGIERIEVPSEKNLNPKDIEISAMRASGPGGQHVNKTSSAIRVVHRPTGLSAIAQDGRSQHQNRKLALARLNLLLKRNEERTRSSLEKQRWDLHNQLERGNPIRVYEGKEFRQSFK